MRAKGIPIRGQGRPTKQRPSVPSEIRATGGTTKHSRRREPKPQRKNGEPGFDPEAFLTQTGLGRTVLSLQKNEQAFAQGDPADAIFYIQKGQIKVTITSKHGKEATVALVGAGDFLGEDSVASTHPLRLATATAMTGCTLLRISKAEMVRALHQEHALSDLFVSFLLARNARIQADLVDQLFNSSEKRLARVLLLLAQFGKASKPETVIPKISQEILAEMIGTTRSRVNFFMNRFRKMGFIEYNGEIQVHNSLLNIFLQEYRFCTFCADLGAHDAAGPRESYRTMNPRARFPAAGQPPSVISDTSGNEQDPRLFPFGRPAVCPEQSGRAPP
jgi:CRP/FNR family transcriptional regulator, cyclic AMP receptor protein